MIEALDESTLSYKPGRSSAALVFLVATTGIAISIRLAFYDLFTTYQPWDDEGYMLLASKFLLDGRVIYDQVFTPYGPFHFLVHWIVHVPLHVPLTHDAIRIVTLGHWVVLSAICGGITWTATRSVAWSFCSYLLVFFYMRAFINEPGHTQEIAAVLGGLIPLLGARIGRRGSHSARWGLIGALGALTLMSKVNVGIFCIGSALSVWWTELPSRPRLLSILCVLFTTAVPLLLMRSFFDTSEGLSYAAVAAVAMGATSFAILNPRASGEPTSRSTLLSILVGGVLGFLICIGFMLAKGSTFAGFLRAMKFYVSGQQYFFQFPDISSLNFIVLLAVIPALFLLKGTLRPFHRKCAFFAQLAFVGVAIWFVLANETGYMLTYLAPWAWLCVIASSSSTHGRLHRDAMTVRKLVASVSAWHIMLPYPVAGTQVSFATFLVVVAAAICGYDACVALTDSLAGVNDLKQRPISTILGGAVCALFLLAMLMRTSRLHDLYASRSPSGLRGMNWVRMPDDRAAVYRDLVVAANDADVVFVTSGLSSLYFWANKEPAFPILVPHDLRVLPPQDRTKIVEALAAARRPMIIHEWTAFGSLPECDLVDWIRTNFEQFGRRSSFAFMRRKVS